MFWKTTTVTACLLLFTGCDGSDPIASSRDTPLDSALEDALARAGGAESYLLPSSDDLEAIPQDPLNPLTREKVVLGQLLLHETSMAVNAKKADGTGMYSCASCHHAASGFQAGVPQGIGEGGIGFGRFGERRRRDPAYVPTDLDTQPVRSPTILNTAFQDVMLWNGQFGATGTNAGTESRWAAGTPIATNELGFQGLEIQAIAGLSVHRLVDGAATLYATFPEYRTLFDAAFPERPAGERATPETAGLAIAAYERTLLADRAPFQRWLRGETDAMSSAQKRGAVVFFAEANCSTCHGGPALSTGADGSTEFHAVGMGELLGPGVFSDFNPTDPVHLGRGGFTDRASDEYTFKTPTLYNLADHGFYGHGATFNTIREVVDYKNEAVSQSSIVPTDRLSPWFVPQNLSLDQVDDLVAFLEGGLYDPDLSRYVPESLPSGACFPNNDPETKGDLGCGTGPQSIPLTLLGRGRQTGIAM